MMSSNGSVYSSLFTSGLLYTGNTQRNNQTFQPTATRPTDPTSSINAFLQPPNPPFQQAASSSPSRRFRTPNSPSRRKRRSSITANASPMAAIKSPSRAAAFSGRIQNFLMSGPLKETRNIASGLFGSNNNGPNTSTKLERPRRALLPSLRKPAPTTPLPAIPFPSDASDSITTPRAVYKPAASASTRGRTPLSTLQAGQGMYPALQPSVPVFSKRQDYRREASMPTVNEWETFGERDRDDIPSENEMEMAW